MPKPGKTKTPSGQSSKIDPVTVSADHTTRWVYAVCETLGSPCLRDDSDMTDLTGLGVRMGQHDRDLTLSLIRRLLKKKGT